MPNLTHLLGFNGRYWEDVRILDAAILQFHTSLPPMGTPARGLGTIIDDEARSFVALVQDLALRPSSPPTPESMSHLMTLLTGSVTPAPEPHQWVTFTISFAHIASSSATIEVHSNFSERDESEYQIVLDAARHIANVVRVVGLEAGGRILVDPKSMHILIGVSSTVMKRRPLGLLPHLDLTYSSLFTSNSSGSTPPPSYSIKSGRQLVHA